MAGFVDKVPHFGNSLSCVVKVYTDEGFTGIGEAGVGMRCDIERIRQNILGCDVYEVSRIANVTVFGRGNSLRSRAKNDILAGTKEMSAVEFALWECIAKKAG
ncbi:MAG: hypothetical protein FWH25_03680, partial [Syntrophorhabdaceae bacterium]|nr:hypothetical protein [Syntrophorhabdaceae bacterium]